MAQFDYIVSNPPFKTDFSDTREALASEKYRERFFAGVPKIPNTKKESMSIYLMFIQHILYSLKDNGKAAIVVPTGFLTAQAGIEKTIREYLINNKIVKSVVSMPSNIFATTGTNVSIVFIDKSQKNEKITLVDASNLGTKIKDGKAQKTVLNDEEIAKIIDSINNNIEIEDFSVVVELEKIINKGYSLSASQFFEIKTTFYEYTESEFKQVLNDFKEKLSENDRNLSKLNSEIIADLEMMYIEK